MVEEEIVSTQTEVQEQTEPLEDVSKNEDESKDEKVVLTKDEYEKKLQSVRKSERSKTETEFLKSLGVSSIKEFKEKEESFKSTAKELEEYKGKNEALLTEIESVKTERILDKLGIEQEWRENILEDAKKLMASDESLTKEQALRQLSETKYNFGKVDQALRIGVEKSTQQSNKDGISPVLKSKYPDIFGTN